MKDPHEFKQELDRKLGLFSLVAYGLNYMIPLAPAIIFGYVLKDSGGTVVIPYLIAFIAMMFTAISYCFFVRRLPVCGSAFSYIDYSFNSRLIGGIAGWNILLDYIFVPTLTAMSAAYYIHQLIPFFPFYGIVFIFILTCGTISLLSIKSIGLFGIVFCIISELVLLITLFFWGYAVYNGNGVGHLFSTVPFRFDSLKSLSLASSLALLSFLGFDAITTLSEEAINPQKDIPRAILICLFIGLITMLAVGYLGVCLVPNWKTHIFETEWLASSFFYINKLAGGNLLNYFFIFFFVISMAVFNIVAIIGASRLLYAMARRGVIPKKLSIIQKTNKSPVVAIAIIIIFQLTTIFIFSLDNIAALVNYGAISAFSILNIAFSFVALKENKKILFLIGIIGFLINIVVLFSMPILTLSIGGIWTLIGLLYLFSQRTK